MKAVAKNILTIVLAVAVFFSASGVTVFKMVCSKSNKTVVSFAELKNCCKHKSKSGVNVSKKCCDLSSKTLKVEQLYKTNPPSYSFNSLQHSLFVIQYSLFNFFSSVKLFAFDSSPPLSGRNILLSISTLLI
jgi:hypothetical protein